MERIDLTDLTILIPVRVDSIIRLENLFSVVNYLHRHFKTHVMVLEASSYNNRVISTILCDSIDYTFIKDDDPVFHRTYYLNLLTRRAQTEFVGIWDADAVIPPPQMQSSMEKLRSTLFDVAFPYNGTFLDTTTIIRKFFVETGDMNVLYDNTKKMILPYGTDMRGGAILVNRLKYIESGMENEKFYGWGPEDWERVGRWANLHYKMYKCEGVLYHLSHPRDINGKHNSERQKRRSFYELHKMLNSSSKEIMAIMSVNTNQ